MNKFKGTPGPWSCEYNGYFFNIKPKGSHQDLAMTHANKHIGIDNVTEEANANLIAAAPELLEALRDMLSGWQYIRTQHGDLYGVGWNRAERKAVVAINKALGLGTIK